MKKYFLGATAIVIALAFSAFKAPKPQATQTFSLDESTLGTITKPIAENVLNWEPVELGCTGGSRAACAIQGISEIYYHVENGSDLVLNSEDFINTNRQDPDQFDSEMIISTTVGNTQGVYLVHTVISGAIKNKN